jgi:hypothetical protein
MSIIQALADAASAEVAVGPLIWKVRRVEPKDMMRHGVPGVLILQEIMTPARPGAKAPNTDPRKMSKGQREKALKAQTEFGAMVCAGITHVREKGGPWEEVSVVMAGPSTDTRLWVNDLPPGTVNALYPQIFLLSAPEESAKRLRSFLGGPNEADDDPEGGAVLREVAS